LGVDAGKVIRVAAEPGDGAGEIEFVLRVGDDQYRYRGVGAQIELEEISFEFARTMVWTNPADEHDVNGDSDVAPNDALIIINQLNAAGSHPLPQSVVRQVSANDGTYFVDVNGDGRLSPIDALRVINRLNALSVIHTNPAQVEDNAEPLVIARLFDQISAYVGDSNLDGRFDSSDLVQIFQAGEYEDSADNNSTWSEGDWDGDRNFTTGDLILAFQRDRYSAASRSSELTTDAGHVVDEIMAEWDVASPAELVA
jgi:hypothetical protein